MASIRPVTRSLPGSQDCLEESSLPLACVLNPLADSLLEKENGKDISSHVYSSDGRPLTSIPKCVHCGAPHPDTTTHYRPPGAHLGRNQQVQLLCYLCGSTFVAPASASSVGEGDDRSSESGKKTPSSFTFPLPLRLPAHNSSSNNSNNNMNGTHARKNPPYSIPAISCPTLWCLVLDGNCTDRLYWQTVSRLVSTTLARSSSSPPPPHVHLSIIMTSYSSNSRTTTSTSGGRNHSNSHRNTKHSNITAEAAEGITTWGIWDLRSALPHVVHYYETDQLDHDKSSGATTNISAGSSISSNRTNQMLMTALADSFCAIRTAHVDSVARALLDYQPPAAARDTPWSSSSFPLGWTVQRVLDALARTARPVGQRARPDDPYEPDDDMNNHRAAYSQAQSRIRPYAGGKITVLCGGGGGRMGRASTSYPITEIAQASSNYGIHPNNIGTGRSSSWVSPSDPQTTRTSTFFETEPHLLSSSSRSCIGKGGFGGRIGTEAPGQRFAATANATQAATDPSDTPSSDPNLTDLTPPGLGRHYGIEKSDATAVAAYFSDLGRECAHAALGVDLLFLVDGGNNNGDDTGLAATPSSFERQQLPNEIPNFGVALLQGLADRSGAPGPLFFDISSPKNGRPSGTTSNGTDTKLSAVSLLQREFVSRTPWQEHCVFGAELRLRMSEGVEVDPTPVEGNNGATSPSGGPQISTLMVESGLLGPATAVDDATPLWCMGTCDPHTAYTIDLRLNSRGAWRSGKEAGSVFMDGVGHVAIQPVLQTCFAYTKIIRDPVDGTYYTVRQLLVGSRRWPLAQTPEDLYNALDTEALAVVLYQKLVLAAWQDGLLEVPNIAQEWLESLLVSVYHSAERKFLIEKEKEEKGLALDDSFYPGDRLLGHPGDLSSRDVLLAQGHERLRPIALMVYLLLQCDALRQTSTSSIDLRTAALSQMMSMSPSTLTRCIAPRLQLWASGSDNGNMSDQEDENSPILEVLDLRAKSLQQAVMEFGGNTDLFILIDTPDQIAVLDAKHVSASVNSKHKKPTMMLSEGLKDVIAAAKQSYRTQPQEVYNFDHRDGSADLQRSFESLSLNILADVLIEDTHSSTGHANYREWKAELATMVNEIMETQ